MSSLYDFFGGDPSSWRKFTRIAIRQIGIPQPWWPDAHQEATAILLRTSYDPQRLEGEILSYARRGIYLALLDWHRRTVLPATVKNGDGGEDRIYAADIDNIDDIGPVPDSVAVLAARHHRRPDEVLEGEGAIEPKTEAHRFVDEHLTLPDQPELRDVYMQIIDLLLKGHSTEEVAVIMEVSQRTIQRYFKRIKDESSQH